MNIQINTAAIMDVSAKLDQLANKMEALFGDISKTVDSTEHIYQSESANSYRAQFNGLKSTFTDFHAAVVAYKDFLNKTVSEYEAAYNAVDKVTQNDVNSGYNG